MICYQVIHYNNEGKIIHSSFHYTLKNARKRVRERINLCNKGDLVKILGERHMGNCIWKYYRKWEYIINDNNVKCEQINCK